MLPRQAILLVLEGVRNAENKTSVKAHLSILKMDWMSLKMRCKTCKSRCNCQCHSHGASGANLNLRAIMRKKLMGNKWDQGILVRGLKLNRQSVPKSLLKILCLVQNKRCTFEIIIRASDWLRKREHHTRLYTGTLRLKVGPLHKHLLKFAVVTAQMLATPMALPHWHHCSYQRN